MPMTREFLESPEERLRKLSEQKSSLQAEISSHEEILNANKEVGMNGPLVDLEGFPRNDIDIYAVRAARVKLIQLANDYRKCMDEISQALIQLHSQGSSSQGTEGTERLAGGDSDEGIKVYAMVDAVHPDSPASEAGLKRGDAIVTFGPFPTSSQLAVTGNSEQILKQIAEVVQKNENVEIEVSVVRGYVKGGPAPTTVHHLRLRPQKWSGRGLLGCHIVPI